MLNHQLSTLYSPFLKRELPIFVLKMPKHFVYILASCLLLACSSEEDKGEVLAEVYEEKLYETDLKAYLLEQGYSAADSALLAQSYVNSWVEEQILLHEAKENKKLDAEKIDEKVEQFRKDMYILELEQILVDEKLDTNISEAEIKKYYDTHPNEFQLNDYLVKVLYLKIPVDAPDIDKIGNKYKLTQADDIEEIEVYAKIYATNYYYDEENWIYFDDLLKEIPLQDINKDRFIMKKSKIRFEENGYHFFLNVLDFKLKNTLSPLNFERNNIKERILNIRIKELREEIRNDIIKNAYESQSVTIY